MKRPQQAAAATAEAAEQTMALYDACWFHRLVLLPSPTPAAAAAAPPRAAALPSQQQAPPGREAVDTHCTPHAQGPASSSPTAAGGGLRHRRTRSDEATAAAFQGLEPLRLPDSGNRARLETILSGKDGLVVAAPQPQRERSRALARRPVVGPGSRLRRRRRGRSMSELEFEEVKGLQDLGFNFSDADVDAELASIVPGLLRRKRSEEENSRRATAASAPAAAATSSSSVAVNDDDASSVAVAAALHRRPYLSEAWDDEEEEVRRALRNWRIPPAAAGDGDQLKEHLRMWAHTVASAVR